MHRNYKLQHFGNQSKIDKLMYIRKEYIKVAKTLSKMQWNHFYRYGFFSTLNIYKSIDSPMTERYKDVCKRQVDGMLNSYLSNLKTTIKDFITKNVSDVELKKQLYIINKKGIWFSQSSNMNKDILKLSRKIFKYVIGKQKLPSFDNINMTLNNKVVEVQKSKTSEYDYWIRISSFKRGDFIWIPIKSHNYFESVTGEIKDFVQVNFKSNVLAFNLLKDVQMPSYTPVTQKLAIDIGLNNLVTTNLGDQFGIKWKEQLFKYDTKIQKLTKNLQKQKLFKFRTISSRYRKLVSNVRCFIKNEVNRIFNRIIEIYKPSKIYVEKLDFRNQSLSKNLNRLIGNFGKSIISIKLDSISEMFGIEIVYVNPAYTSQTCSKCNHVCKANRKSQSKFECKKCGYTLNADVNASRNILRWDKFKNKSIKEIKSELLSKT